MRTSVKTLAAGTLAAATFLIAPAAMAADGIDTSDTSVVVTGGPLSIDTEVTTGFSNIETAKDALDRTSTIKVTVDDLRGTGAGWNIVQNASDLTVKDAEGGVTETIDASQLSVTGVSDLQKLDGLSDDVPVAPLAQGAFNLGGTGGTILTAAAEDGEGQYTANVGLNLEVPAYSKAGTYTGTLTSTNSPNPGTGNETNPAG